eukprot:CAMPEP_0194486258 /NCGR_PEP_ID=MMETSP0253-20130528/6979_1 /TAXON_ID=2966 /ORGANISM="Noctiluca scintillans" /LENGTH=661 /DNA_ID=CAMNT_0039326329 /DNA_START=35 /DNA_END=2020 /DNA_ORIENTATION=+
MALALVAGTATAAAAAALYAWSQKSHKLSETAEQRDARLRHVLEPAPSGLTLYYALESPCARRVVLTLREKGLPFKECIISLLDGEQRHPAFLAVNPQGKVPVMVCRNMLDTRGIEDVALWESTAIVSWLEDAFPDTNQLVPSEPERRLEVRMWQHWEQCFAEFMWPLSRQQVDGVLWRWHFRSGEFDDAKMRWGNGDPFYTAKITKIFRGCFLTEDEMRRCVVNLARGFGMLERALNDGRPFLVGDHLTQADIAAMPRLIKAPGNGVMATAGQRAAHSHVVNFFERLTKRPAFAKFARPDTVVWSSGSGPKFLGATGFGSKYLNGIPWPILVAIGNWRTGTRFRRMPWRTIMTDDGRLLAGGDAPVELRAMPSREKPCGNVRRIYVNQAMSLCAPVGIILDELADLGKTAGEEQPSFILEDVNAALGANFSASHLTRMPWGELPVLVDTDGLVVYGTMNICEHLVQASVESGFMLEGANGRASVRKWAGWSKTAWHYQLEKLYWADVAGPYLFKRFGQDRAAFEKAVIEALGDTDGKRLRIDAVEPILAYEEAAREATLADEAKKLAREEYVAELGIRCAYVGAHLRSCSDQGAGPFLEGAETPSIADIFVASLVAIATKRYGCTGGEEDNNNALQTWLASLWRRPSFQKHLDFLLTAWK